jgi:hypothetical protein
MPAKKLPGMRRIQIVAEPAWIDAMAEAARRDERSLSQFARSAMNAAARRLGVEVPGQVVKPRGRPRKAKA